MPAATLEAPVPPIALADVAKSFVSRDGTPVAVVDGISLEVPAGTICCLTGPTGCGKSTILRLAAGLEEPDRGRVALSADPGAGAPVGYLTQSHTLLPWLTALDNVALPLRVRGLAAAPARERCRPILETLGLGGAAERYPYELSGGMQQRAALGRLLAANARCWLLDEPFSSLDERTRHRLQDLLVRLVREGSIATLFVTHAVDEAVYLADRVIVLSVAPGRIVADLALRDGHPRDRLSPAYAAHLEVVRRTLEEAIR